MRLNKVRFDRHGSVFVEICVGEIYQSFEGWRYWPHEDCPEELDVEIEGLSKSMVKEEIKKLARF